MALFGAVAGAPTGASPAGAVPQTSSELHLRDEPFETLHRDTVGRLVRAKSGGCPKEVVAAVLARTPQLANPILPLLMPREETMQPQQLASWIQQRSRAVAVDLEDIQKAQKGGCKEAAARSLVVLLEKEKYEWSLLMSESSIQVVDTVSRLTKLHQHTICGLVAKAMSLVVGDSVMRIAKAADDDDSRESTKEVTDLAVRLFLREWYHLCLSLKDILLTADRGQHEARMIVRELGRLGLAKSLCTGVGSILASLESTQQLQGQMGIPQKVSDYLVRPITTTLVDCCVLAFALVEVTGTDEIEAALALIPQTVASTVSLSAPVPFVLGDLELLTPGMTVSDQTEATTGEMRIAPPVRLSQRLTLYMAMAVMGALAPSRSRMQKLQTQLSADTMSHSDLSSTAPTAEPRQPASSVTNKFGSEYWSSDYDTGRLLAFACTGMYGCGGKEEESSKVERTALVYWDILGYVQDDVTSCVLAAAANSSDSPGLVLSRILDTVMSALVLPLHRWTSLKRLETHATKYNLLPPPQAVNAPNRPNRNYLQIMVIIIITRLCLVSDKPLSQSMCMKYKDVVLNKTENFHPTATITEAAAAAPAGGLGRGTAGPYDYPPGYGPNAAPHVVTLFLSLEYAAVLDMCTCMVTRLPQGEAAVKQLVQKLEHHHNPWFNGANMHDHLRKILKAVRQSAITGTLQAGDDEASEGVLLVAPALIRILSACADVGESSVASWQGGATLVEVLTGAPPYSVLARNEVTIACLTGLAHARPRGVDTAAHARAVLQAIVQKTTLLSSLPAPENGDSPSGVSAALLRLVTSLFQRLPESQRWAVGQAEAWMRVTDHVVNRLLFGGKLSDDVSLLSMRWLLRMILAPTQDSEAFVYSTQCLLTLESPVFGQVAAAITSKDTALSETAVELIAACLERDPRNVPNCVPAHKQVELAKTPDGVPLIAHLLQSRQASSRAGLAILSTMCARAPQAIRAIFALHPSMPRQASLALGRILLSSGTGSVYDAAGEVLRYDSLLPVCCITSLCRYDARHDLSRLLLLREVARQVDQRPVVPSGEGSVRYVDRCVRWSPSRLQRFGKLSNDASRWLALSTLNRCGPDLALLFLTGGEEHIADTSSGELSGLDALFFLLDNPPPASSSTEASALYSYLVECVGGFLSSGKDALKGAILRYISFAWSTRYDTLRLALEGDDPVFAARLLEVLAAELSHCGGNSNVEVFRDVAATFLSGLSRRDKQPLLLSLMGRLLYEAKVFEAPEIPEQFQAPLVECLRSAIETDRLPGGMCDPERYLVNVIREFKIEVPRAGEEVEPPLLRGVKALSSREMYRPALALLSGQNTRQSVLLGADQLQTAIVRFLNTAVTYLPASSAEPTLHVLAEAALSLVAEGGPNRSPYIFPVVSRLMSLLYARSTTVSIASALGADGQVARQSASSSGVVAAEWLRGFLKACTPLKLRELSDSVIEHALTVCLILLLRLSSTSCEDLLHTVLDGPLLYVFREVLGKSPTAKGLSYLSLALLSLILRLAPPNDRNIEESIEADWQPIQSALLASKSPLALSTLSLLVQRSAALARTFVEYNGLKQLLEGGHHPPEELLQIAAVVMMKLPYYTPAESLIQGWFRRLRASPDPADFLKSVWPDLCP